MMSRMVAMCLVPALVLGSEATNGEVAFADSPLGSFEKKDVTFSFYMTCYGTCFLTTPSGLRGCFNREAFRTSLGESYNIVATAKREELLNTLTTQQPDGQFGTFVAETFFNLTDSYDPTVANTYYNNIQFDRVIEASDTSNKYGRVKTVAGGEVVPSNFWNVFLRVTMTDIPVSIADDFSAVVVQLINYYPAQINYDSMWISTDAYFITDQLEPVKGRGHKSTRLLIPLLMGIVAMLVVPMIVSAVLVHAAQRAKHDQDRIDSKDREIGALHTAKAEKDAAILTYLDKEKKESTAKNQEIEMRRLRDAAELGEEDVDWTAEKVN